MTETCKCPNCGAQMNRDIRPEEIAFKDRTLTVRQPGFYCTVCDEVVLTIDDIKVTEPAIVDFRAKTEGLLSAVEITQIREQILHLSQRQAGMILGGGPRAFQKYESRKVTVSKPMSNLLRLLRKHPEHLKDLDPGSASSLTHTGPILFGIGA